MAEVDTTELKDLSKIFKNFGKDKTDGQIRNKFKQFGKQGGEKSAATNNARRIENTMWDAMSSALHVLAPQIQFDIKYRFMQEIERFYADLPDPVMYDRTGSLIRAFNPVFEDHVTTFRIGAELDGSYINDPNPYFSIFSKTHTPDDPSEVFNLFYQHGQHGNDFNLPNGTYYNATHISPTPKEAMEKWFKGEYKREVQDMIMIEFKKQLQKRTNRLDGSYRKKE